MKYPVAEMFFSVQGEGAQSGMPMVFVRLAGCTVGKPYTREQREVLGLHIFQNECTIYDGRKFPCDTNYKVSQYLTPEEIVAEVQKLNSGCVWVSITGGEPLMHDLNPLVNELRIAGYRLHLETSGTIPFTFSVRDALSGFEHIVISPKHPFLDDYMLVTDEVRVLVDEEFKWDSLPESVKNKSHMVWVSPINDVGSITKKNADACMALISAHPEIRISMQIHKVLNVR